MCGEVSLLKKAQLNQDDVMITYLVICLSIRDVIEIILQKLRLSNSLWLTKTKLFVFDLVVESNLELSFCVSSFLVSSLIFFKLFLSRV